MKNAISYIFGFIFLVMLGIGASYMASVKQREAAPPPLNAPGTEAPESGINEYRSEEYGFIITLPESWRGYTVTIDRWSGYKPDDQLGEVPAADGPVVSIHNPRWTAETPYQDIPIMVFTLEQWDALQKDAFHIGAAPIGPSELGRNVRYVFALPARYNFAFPPGFEEVDEILQSKPLKTF